MARLLARTMGKAIEPEVNGKYRPGDIRHCIADPAKIERAFGFRPSLRLEDGLGELVEWSKGEEAKDKVAVALRELERRRLVR